MSTNKTKNQLTESFDGFSGIDTTSPIGSGRLTALKNFRLLGDGSAVKRSGFRHICTFAGELRGEKSYADKNEEVILAAVGKTLVRISVADGAILASEVFSKSTGAVKFFEFGGDLYILEGADIYRYLGGCEAERCIPYVPLYGTQWDIGETAGTVNYPMNMLAPKIRISYTANSLYVRTLAVGMKIKSIDAIVYRGEALPSGMYRIHGDGDKVIVDSFFIDGDIELYVTVDTEDYRCSDFEICDKTRVFDAFEDSRVFAYGGSVNERTYVSLPVKNADVEAQNKLFGKIAPLYFPKTAPVNFSGLGKITDMKRVYDRMFVFSEHRSWATESLRSEEGRTAMIPIFETAVETVGCASDGASEIIDGNDLITVSHGGVIKWSVDRDFQAEIRQSRLSAKVGGLFDADFVKNAVTCYNRGENELWIAHVGSENGLVAVYNCANGGWYTFEGIPAESFLKIGEHVAFRSGKSYYVFDTDEGYDVFEDGEREIEAVIESAGFDFSSPAEKKHIGRAFVTCDVGDGVITLELSDGERLIFAELKKSDASKFHDGVDFFDLDVRTGRSERMKFKLFTGGRSIKRIYRVEFIAD